MDSLSNESPILRPLPKLKCTLLLNKEQYSLVRNIDDVSETMFKNFSRDSF